jgi:hypothetical protein
MPKWENKEEYEKWKTDKITQNTDKLKNETTEPPIKEKVAGEMPDAQANESTDYKVDALAMLVILAITLFFYKRLKEQKQLIM